MTDLEEEAGVEALDGCLTAVPLAQVHLTITPTTQKLHQGDVSGVNDLHATGDSLQAELILCWRHSCGRIS